MMWVYTDSCNYGNWDDSSENSCITVANKHNEETATVRVKVIGESTETIKYVYGNDVSVHWFLQLW